MRQPDTQLTLPKSRDTLRSCFNSLFNAVWSQRNDQYAGILTGNRVPLYGKKIAAFETFSRLMWGFFPLLAGEDHPDSEAVLRMLADGTDPSHPHYWGEPQDFDQRSVEMAVFGLGLALAGDTLRQRLGQPAFGRLVIWLQSLRTAKIPQNNWSFFPLMVEAGLYRSGEAWSQATVEKHFALLDSFYLGDGWYSDGPGRPCDYYNGMALHFYGLIWARLMADVYPSRCQQLRERASLFAKDFIHFFDDEGAAIPYGRSMTYRFAQAAFWSAAAFAGLKTVPAGVSKGIILRHLRYWLKQDITDARGILTVGYGYANEIMAEEYNAPGSPYWALKPFLILALDDAHPFWQSEELPLPERPAHHAIKHARQLAVDDRQSGHHYLLNAGQIPGKSYANSESKYAKFAYSSLLGFNLERSRYGLALNACDSTLLLSEHDDYWRGPRDVSIVRIGDNGIALCWQPWPDVRIKTHLIPLRTGHLRIHVIDTGRALNCAEGGFPVPVHEHPATAFDVESGTITSAETGYFTRINDFSPTVKRACAPVISPPASNIVFPCSSAVPVLTHELTPGRHILCCRIDGGRIAPAAPPVPINISLTPHLLELDLDDQLLVIPL